MKINLKGNTSQETTTGKNMYEGSQDFSGTWTNSYAWETDSNTYNGLIVKKRISSWNGINKDLQVEAGKTYTFSCYIKCDTTRQVALYTSGGTATATPSSTNVNPTTSWQRYSITFVANENGTIRPRVENTSASDTNYTYICGYQLEESASMTDYEPFTNGASPNPQYPQGIHVVSGDNTIKIKGKNLCNISSVSASYYSGGLPSGASNQLAIDSFDTTNITFHSTSANYNMALTNVIQLKPSTQYTIKFSRTSTSSNNQWFIYDYDNGTYSVNYRDNNTNTLEHTFTTNNLGQIALAFGHGNTTGTTTISSIMLSSGSTASTYEPYQSQSYAVNLGTMELCKIGDYQDKIAKSTGKNLFNKDNVVGGFVNADGSVGGDTNAYRTSDFIPIQPNTAYYKTSTESPRTKYYDSNKQPLNTTTYQDILIGGNAGTFTTPNNAYYLRFSYPVSSVNANSIMINEGTTALPYEPYGKVWYVNKQINKVVLNGSENWNYQSQYPRFQLTSLSPVPLNNSNLFCSHYIKGQTADTDYVCSLASGTGYSQFLVHDERYTTKEAYNTWLSSNNVSVYYVLKTPTYTEITDSTLISQLEAINGAKSYTTQTNINQENNDNASILNASALSE